MGGVGGVGRTSTAALAIVLAAASVQGWGPQGHRLVATVAANHLTPVARKNVTWLLGDESLADVAVWADEYVEAHRETAPWHYVNIPADGQRYVADRDCLRGDCVVDRIRYHRERLANRSLRRPDRAMGQRPAADSQRQHREKARPEELRPGLVRVDERLTSGRT